MTNILFICKYNRFRSRVGEAYFNKINKNKNNFAKSRGIIRGSLPLDKQEVKIANKMGINIEGNPETLDIPILKWVDLIVIVADNVPEEIFRSKDGEYKKNVLVWNVKDIEADAPDEIVEKTIKEITLNVDKLVEEIK